MKYKIGLLFICVLNLNEISFAQQQLLVLNRDGTQSSFSSVFADEFNGTSLDENKWMNAYPWGRHLTGNSPDEETLEYYTDGKNIILRNGLLLLEARKERTCGNCESWVDSSALNKNGQQNYRCFDYSSGMIYSKEEFGFGYYEIHFKQSLNSKGMWPAFWMYGNSEEIDVFENKGERTNATHWDLHCKGGCNKKYGGWKKVKTDFTREFNTISFNWSQIKQQWFCNGENYASAKQEYSGKMHMIATNAVSRDRKGNGFWVGTDETTVFPASLDIDLIRYYKTNYEGRKCGFFPEDDALVLQLRNSTLAYTKEPQKTKNDQLLNIYIDQKLHKLVINYYGDKGKPARIAVYNSYGQLIKAEQINKKGKVTIDKLPEDSLLIIARIEKKTLAERVELAR